MNRYVQPRRRRQDEQVGFVHPTCGGPKQCLPDEDDAPLWWEKFRLLVPLGNVGRLYTGSSRPSASSFLSRISDSSDHPELRHSLDPWFLLSSSTDSSKSLRSSRTLGKSEQGKKRPARRKRIIDYLRNFSSSILKDRCFFSPGV